MAGVKKYKYRMGKSSLSGDMPNVGIKANYIECIKDKKRAITKTVAWNNALGLVRPYEFRNGELVPLINNAKVQGVYFPFFQIQYIGEVTIVDDRIERLEVFMPGSIDSNESVLNAVKINNCRDFTNKLIQSLSINMI